MVTAWDDAKAELARAREEHGAMASGHEGIAVIEEEFIELRNEVFWGPTDLGPTARRMIGKERRRERMRAEAVQLAAMAIRFIEDVCDEPRGPLRTPESGHGTHGVGDSTSPGRSPSRTTHTTQVGTQRSERTSSASRRSWRLRTA